MSNKSFKLIAVLIAAVLSFTACNKNEGGENDFGPKTPEETKITIEQTGIKMIDQMRALEQSQAIDVSESFISFLSESDPFYYKSATIYNTGAFKSLRNVATMDDGVKYSKVLEDMRTYDDPETIQEFFNELAGTYEWNSELGYWKETLGGNEIVFKFPSSEESSENDAIFRIYNYTGYNGDNYLKEYDEYDGDLPQTLNAELKAGDVTVMSYFFDIAYDADGIPSSISTELFVVPFTFSASFTNTYTKGKIVYTIDHDGEEVVNLTAEMNGDWSKDNIDANIEEDCETNPDYIYNPETGDYEETQVTYCYDELMYPEKVFKTANATFRIMDVKMEGTLNFAGLWTDMMALDEKYEDENGYWNLTEEEDSLYMLEEVEALNKHIAVVARQVSDNKIIAKLEAYPYVDHYTYEDYYYNGQWNETPIVVEETDYWSDMRFVFGDDSRVDAATYFGEGFDDFLKDLNDFIEDLNSIYDTDIDEI